MPIYQAAKIFVVQILIVVHISNPKLNFYVMEEDEFNPYEPEYVVGPRSAKFLVCAGSHLYKLSKVV